VKKVFAFLASFCLVSVAFLAGALPASAHADLVSTNPVDGAALTEAPESLVLSFNSLVLDGMAEVAISDSAGELVAGVVAETVETEVLVSWPVDLPGDTYNVAYRIVSEDGHPVTGSFAFSYPETSIPLTAETAAEEPAISTEPTPDQTSDVEVASEVTVDASSESSSESSSEPSSGSESGSMIVWVVGFLVLAGVVASYFIWRKRSA
jgi:hypothetical protein